MLILQDVNSPNRKKRVKLLKLYLSNDRVKRSRLEQLFKYHLVVQNYRSPVVFIFKFTILTLRPFLFVNIKLLTSSLKYIAEWKASRIKERRQTRSNLWEGGWPYQFFGNNFFFSHWYFDKLDPISLPCFVDSLKVISIVGI